MKWDYLIVDVASRSANPANPGGLDQVSGEVDADTEAEAEAAAWDRWDAAYDQRPANPQVTIEPAPSWRR